MAFDERIAWNIAYRRMHNCQARQTNGGILTMLAEFSVVPIGAGESLSGYVAECIRIVEMSGLEYRLQPMGTVVEGEYDDVMAVVSACHKKVAGMCARVLTTIRIDDRRGAEDAIDSKVTAVLRKVEKAEREGV